MPSSKREENEKLVAELIEALNEAIPYELLTDDYPDIDPSPQVEAVREAGLMSCLKAVHQHGSKAQQKVALQHMRDLADKGGGRDKIKAILLLLSVNTKEVKKEGDPADVCKVNRPLEI